METPPGCGLIIHMRKGLREGDYEHAGEERPGVSVGTARHFVQTRWLWIVPKGSRRGGDSLTTAHYKKKFLPKVKAAV
jgi:hypothetical protein